MDEPPKRSPDSTQFFECKYCKKKFHPLLAHDLHIMSKHALQWSSTPRFVSSGCFSLATSDLLKIAQREFGSLRSITIDDISSTSGTPSTAPVFTATSTGKSAAIKIQPGKRKAENSDAEKQKNDVDNDARPSNSWAAGTANKRPRASSLGDMRTDAPNSVKSSTVVEAKPNESTAAAVKSENVTIYVASSLTRSRQHRLALTGKPYYLEDTDSRHRSNNSQRTGDSSNSRSAESNATTTIHAFRCFPNNTSIASPEKGHVAGVYVFQPLDAADLLRNLTWKKTKALRQKLETANDKGQQSKENEDSGGRFANRRRGITSFSRLRGRPIRNDDPHNRASYRTFAYGQRVSRGRVYDARIDTVQAQSENNCKIKNALHLYLLQSAAGDRGSTVSEAPFWHKNKRHQAILPNTGASTSASKN